MSLKIYKHHDFFNIKISHISILIFLYVQNVSNKNVSQHRLRCAQADDLSRNGNAVMVGAFQDADENRYKQLSANVATLMDCQAKLHRAIDRTQLLQWILMGITVMLSVIIIYFVKNEIQSVNTTNSCFKNAAP